MMEVANPNDGGGASTSGGSVLLGEAQWQMAAAADLERLQARLREAASGFQPAICRRQPEDIRYLADAGVEVPDWRTIHDTGAGAGPQEPIVPMPAARRPADDAAPAPRASSHKTLRQQTKGKSSGTGRTYTSKYRGVHQTFPTKRWEAQFRRNGKPTSLGCFDTEDEAARAYDKMMLWAELHNAAGVKSGITNFDISHYDAEVAWLKRITQDDLIESLRGEGRRQAAHRMLRAKREGLDNDNDSEDEAQHMATDVAAGGGRARAQSAASGDASGGLMEE